MSLKHLGGLVLVVFAINGMAADGGLNPAKSLPPGEPVEYSKPITNSSALPSAAPAAQSRPVTIVPKDSVPQPLLPGAYVSAWLLDTVKLAQAGIDQSIILNFIDSAGTFNLTAEQIIYVRDMGLSTEVITSMIQHDAEIVSGLRQAPAAPSASEPTIRLTFVHNDAPQPESSRSEPNEAFSPTKSIVTVPTRNDSDEHLATPVERKNGFVLTRPRGLIKSQPLPIHAVTSPVRLPYPVQLTDPILVLPGEGRTPNLIVIEF